MANELLNLSKLGVAQVNAGKAGARHTALVEARAVFDAAFNQLAALQATAYSGVGVANEELLAVATANSVALPNVGEYSQIYSLLQAERPDRLHLGNFRVFREHVEVVVDRVQLDA